MKNSISLFLILIFFILISEKSYSGEYNVLDYGAVADGKTLNTKAIQKAVDECAKNGGGIIEFPAGKYLTGTIYFKNNVTLYLQNGAIILGSTRLNDYPENTPDYNFFRNGKIKRSLFYAEKCENIAIKGDGTIDGQGGLITRPDGRPGSSYGERPHVIWMIQSKNIKIEGVKLQNSALWMQHYIACESLYIHNIEVYNHANKNNDMMDINGCKDVIISDCKGDTDDDGITLKSTHTMPNENITITNCIISSHCNAIKCGTESIAGFKNITISNCIVRPSKDKEPIYGKPEGISGISLEIVDGARMNGVNISNIIIDGPQVPIFIRLGNRARGYDEDLPKPTVGSIENITISNITAFNADATGCSITGIPGHRVKHITLDNIKIYYKGGGNLKDSQRDIPEKINNYPEATMFEHLPAYGFFVRHVENISFYNVELYYKKEDLRSAFYFDDVTNGKIVDILAKINVSSALIKANNIQDILIDYPKIQNYCSALLEISGEKTRSVFITNIDRSKFLKLIKFSKETDKKIIKTGIIFDN